MPSSRINAQVGAPSCGLYITCGRNQQLKITSYEVYTEAN
jgi:hypothetical protein